jgi:uncharacterized protein YndB with AHSA1/START domain
MKDEGSVEVRVSHTFSASAERVFDAWLDPQKACQFLFATATGRVVRAEIDARVGGSYRIVDRRGGEDVEHTGEYLELERPRLLVFTLSVPRYSASISTVRVEISPSGSGCEVAVVHRMGPTPPELRARTGEGWRRILEVLAELLPPAEPSCGAGLASHSTVPARIAPLFAALADTLELHREMLDSKDPLARQEDEAYSELASGYRALSAGIAATAARMAGYRSLPACAHDSSAFGPRHLQAFERFVAAQTELLEILRVAAERDQKLLASMKPSA